MLINNSNQQKIVSSEQQPQKPSKKPNISKKTNMSLDKVAKNIEETQKTKKTQLYFWDGARPT